MLYALPTDDDLKFLLGKTVELVCFAAYSLYIHMNENIMITVESSFRHLRDGDESQSSEEAFPLSQSTLMRLLGNSVNSVHGKDNGTLRLDFSNNDVLIIYGDNGPYEAYHIKHGDSVITV